MDDMAGQGSSSNKASKLSGRPYGWVDLKFESGSNIIYNLPVIQNDSGYIVSLVCTLFTLDLSTSINYASLIEAEELKVSLNYLIMHERSLPQILELKKN